ncbi:sigma-70 family RNA polymerase sigma factor [Cytobacillus sp. IB215665]|uniref:sigma-70 family RNA polymerase sigma factor n=1 Tax=Cytobacillus sp. IB215665 TaxID=3097357 RepID=UPI002A12E253|nr:sigma-70 family RNA polymerase sigma factor [Cytobacillus sp. IB215665]MDX8365345.1 sigma-70 family RNA polymerase sigma factor [Cytobacillus sp. IB215665]
MKSTNKNFIRRLQRQKEDALEFIVDNYLPLIKGITYKVLSPLNNEGIIEECTNDTFLSIWNNAKKFSGDETDFKKWISAIAKYKAIDYYRKASKAFESTTHEMDITEGKSVEDELIMAEDRAELLQLINELEPVDRNIFIMKFFLGLNNEEISQKVGLTKSSVDNRIYRGKKNLSKQATSLHLRGNVI